MSSINAPAIACRLGALGPEGRARQKELLQRVTSRVLEISERPDGFVLSLAADRNLVTAAAEWIGLERLCCPFASFSLEWDQDDAVRITITGPEGAKDVLAAEMALRR